MTGYITESYSDDVSEWENGEKIHEATEYNVHKDCSSFTLTFNTEKDTHFHMPTECPNHMVSEEEQAVCDPPDQFPMKCTFHLIDHSNEYEENDRQQRMVADMDGFNHTSLEKVVSNERDLLSTSTKKSSSVSKRGKGKGKGKERDLVSTSNKKSSSVSKHGDQYMWAAQSYYKLFSAQSTNKCKPNWRERRDRGMQCSTCRWAWFVWPCNCNCRGWNQVGAVCYEPCGGGEVGILKNCFESCSDTIALHTGCGLIPGERTCVKNDNECINKYANHAMNIFDVVTFFASAGTVSTFKKSVTVALKIAKSSTRKAFLKTALTDIASEMTRKMVNNPQIRNELSQYGTAVGQRILDQGAVLLIASNLEEITEASEDIKFVALEIAKAVDPSGMVSLVSGFVPPDDCDEVTFTKMPKPNNDLPNTEVLDAIDAIAPSSVITVSVSRYNNNGMCVGYDYWGDLYLYTCNDQEDQMFILDDNNRLVVQGGPKQGQCLLADGWTWPKLRPCDNDDKQKWKYLNGKFVTYGGAKCLREYQTSNTRLKVHDCNNMEWDQIWSWGSEEAPSVFVPSDQHTSYIDQGGCGPRGDDAREDMSDCLNGYYLVGAKYLNNWQIVAKVDECDFYEYKIFACN